MNLSSEEVTNLIYSIEEALEATKDYKKKKHFKKSIERIELRRRRWKALLERLQEEFLKD